MVIINGALFTDAPRIRVSDTHNTASGPCDPRVHACWTRWPEARHTYGWTQPVPPPV